MPRTRLGRLRKGREFDQAYSEGTVSSGPFFVIRVKPNGLQQSRVGYAVGKRLVPLATGRNVVRRRLRCAVVDAAVPAGLDLIVTTKQPAVAASYNELSAALKRELARALERAGTPE